MISIVYSDLGKTTQKGVIMSRRFVIELEDDEVLDAEKRYGAKNIGYEILKAYRSNQKRIRNIEAAKEVKRARVSDRE